MRFLRRLVNTVRRNGLRGLAQTALTLTEDKLFDWRYGVATSGLIHLASLAIEGPNVVHGVDYQPMRARYFRLMLHEIEVPKDSVLVDFGAGKGRILLLAARTGCFKKVVGVEFSPDLCHAARQNIDAFRDLRSSDVDFDVVNADVANYHVCPDQNVFFMYNPFDQVVLEQVLRNIDESLIQRPRPVWIIYHGVDENCLNLIADREGYVEIRHLSYGNARVTVFVNSGAQFGPTKTPPPLPAPAVTDRPYEGGSTPRDDLRPV
jgi:SAM-dependent methyltransferase